MLALALAPAEPPTSDPESIEALLRAASYGEALAAATRAYGAVLGRLCMALLGSQADAEEATQETLLRAYRGMANFRGEGTIKAWLCGIARHVCAHMLETRRKGREATELMVVVSADEATPASRLRHRALRQALARLRPSERDVLVLRFVAGLSHREIAAACNVDEATARKRASRALAHLRTILPGETP